MRLRTLRRATLVTGLVLGICRLEPRMHDTVASGLVLLAAGLALGAWRRRLRSWRASWTTRPGPARWLGHAAASLLLIGGIGAVGLLAWSAGMAFAAGGALLGPPRPSP